jgi:hypothetical protein
MNHSITSDESYPVFMPNQVLGSEDLNAVVDYLNNQSHLTRSQLIGQGITQGMIVSVRQVQSDRNTQIAISISPGVGIAADGQLIVLDKTIQLTHYKPDDSQKPIEIFASQKENRDELQPIDRSDASLDRILKNSVLAVIFAYQDTARPSPLLSYTEMGKDRQFYLRFFLLPKEQIEISTSTTIAPSTLVAPVLRRFGYQNKDNTVRLSIISTTSDFSTNYSACCEEAIATLHTSLEAIMNRIKTIPALSEQGISSSILEELKGKLEQKLNTLNIQNGIQYFYDYLNQIAAAHRELIDAISKLIGDRPFSPKIKPNASSADIAEKPHLLLGQINPERGQLQGFSTFDLYRQHFIQHQIEDTATQPQINRIRYLFTRLLRLSDADNFQMPTSSDHSIKIIPSGDRSHFLSHQAIPYYLTYANLSFYWNYDASLNGTTQTHPAYFSQTNHLLSSLDAYGLYRIEGYAGRSCRDVLTQITTIQQNYNLAFDVLCLKLNAAVTPVDNPQQEHFFHRFAQSYPGLEHLGGVPKGGTFILVYVEQENSDVIIADFSLPYRVELHAELPAPSSLTLSIAKTTFTEEEDPVEVTLLPNYGIVEGEGILAEPGKFSFAPRQLKENIEGAQKEIVITGRWGNHYKTEIVTVNALLSLSMENDKITLTEEDEKAEIRLSPTKGAIAEGRGVIEQAGKFYFDPSQLKGKIDGNQEFVTITGKWGNYFRTQMITVTAFTLFIEKTTFTEEDEEYEITVFPKNGIVEGRGVEQRQDKFYFVPRKLKGHIDRWVDIVITGKWNSYRRTKTITVNAIALLIEKTIFTVDDTRVEINLFPEGGTVEGEGIEQEGSQFYFVPSHLKDINRRVTIPITGRWGNANRTQMLTVYALMLAMEKTRFAEDDARTEITLFPDYGIAEGDGVQEQAGKFYFLPSQLQAIDRQVEIEITGKWDNQSRTQTVTVYTQPLAEFSLGNVVSGPDSQGNEVRVELDRASSPIPLIPKIQEGNFQAFTKLGLQLNNLFQQTETGEWRLILQNIAAEITEFIVKYKLQPMWGEQTSFIIVSLPNANAAPSSSGEEVDPPSSLERAPLPTIPESSSETPSSGASLPESSALEAPPDSSRLTPVSDPSFPRGTFESPSFNLSLPNPSPLESPLPAPRLTELPQASAAPTSPSLMDLSQPNRASVEPSLSFGNVSDRNEDSRFPISGNQISGNQMFAPPSETLSQETLLPNSRNSVSPARSSDENKPRTGFWQQVLYILTRPIG